MRTLHVWGLYCAVLLNLGVAVASEKVEVVLREPTAGIDFPTDVPTPESFRNRLVMVVNSSQMLIEKPAHLASPQAGIDYPTDVPAPEWTGNSKILVLDHEKHLPLIVEKAQAGIDFPTDFPRRPAPKFLVFAFSETLRIRVNQLASIEKAVAGIDFPTDGPADLKREFYVAVDKQGHRFPL